MKRVFYGVYGSDTWVNLEEKERGGRGELYFVAKGGLESELGDSGAVSIYHVCTSIFAVARANAGLPERKKGK